MLVYRIADGRHPVFDGTGAMLHGGRWNSPGRAVIYAAESYAGAMLEVLVHANLSLMPRNQAAVEISIPEVLPREAVSADELSKWPNVSERECRALGDAWLRRAESAILYVPSIVTAGHGRNVLLNPAHADFKRIRASSPERVKWDTRLFRSAI